jgi:hypothetical protein
MFTVHAYGDNKSMATVQAGVEDDGRRLAVERFGKLNKAGR